MQIFLTSSESKLRVRDGMFEVSYYDKEGNLQKSQHAPALLKGIWLHDGASITVAAIRLAMQNDVDLVICNRRGIPEGRLLGFRPSTTSLVQKAQALVSISPQALEYARGWIVRKLQSQAEYLECLVMRRSAQQKKSLELAIQHIREMLGKAQTLDMSPPKSSESPASTPTAILRGLEGSASRSFYAALAEVIPPQYTFEGRSKRPARDIFNAFLNYAFGILYRKIECALTAAGMNSYIGFMHRDGYQFKSLVYDFIEPFRTDMVRAVFTLFSKKLIKINTHAVVSPDGSVELTNAGIGVLAQKVNKFYEKKTVFESLNMSREMAIEKEARRLA